jgi:hypothetical protein
VSDFAQTAAVQAGIVLPRGGWDRGLALLETPVPASHYIHPEFGFFCPTPRFRRRLGVALACLVVAGVGAAVMATAERPPKLAAAVTRADEASIGETTPATSLPPFAAAVARLPIVAGAQTTADKPSCVGDTRTEGNCVSVKLRKPRMVWVANDRPAIAAVALGRSAAPTTRSIDAALLAARAGSQGDPARSGEAAVAAASAGHGGISQGIPRVCAGMFALGRRDQKSGA